MKNKMLCVMIMAMVLLTSCSSLGIFGESSAAVSKQNNKIVAVDNKLNDLSDTKLNQVSQLSYGVNDSLQRITNAPIEVKVAKELNQRVESISGLPTLEQQKAMVKMVTDLIATNIAGVRELKQKDNEISALQNEETVLLKSKDREINNALELSKTVALQNDTTQAELSKYTAYWGIGGIFLGVKSLSLHLFWATLIFIVIFIILRALSMTNPLASAIFGIFQSIGASIIHLVETLIPQSIGTLNDVKSAVLVVSNAVDTAAQMPSTTTATPTVTSSTTMIATTKTDEPINAKSV